VSRLNADQKKFPSTPPAACLAQAIATCKNRQHVICSLGHGSKENLSKIVMKKENQPLDVWYGCVRFECRSNKICVNDKFSWGVKI